MRAPQLASFVFRPRHACTPHARGLRNAHCAHHPILSLRLGWLVVTSAGQGSSAALRARHPATYVDLCALGELVLVAGRNVVEQVSFSLGRGEILGLAGLVGAGRSEVVNALYGRSDFSGRVFLEGQEVRLRNPREAMRLGVGLVTEERKKEGLLLDRSVRENITLHHLRKVSRGIWLSSHLEDEVAEEFRNRLNLRAPSLRAPVHQLSGGNQQKVVLSKILLPEPKVILLDEPTKGIDVGAKSEIYRLIFDLSRQGVSFVLISSELPELLALCDRFVVLARGRLTARLNKSEATEETIMASATG